MIILRIYKETEYIFKNQSILIESTLLKLIALLFMFRAETKNTRTASKPYGKTHLVIFSVG